VTSGTIVELCFEEQIPAQGGQPASTVIRWELEALPTAGSNYSQTYEISPREPHSQAEIIAAFHGGTVSATPAGANRLRFEGTLFGDHGHSGSIWVDNDRHVVGLHWGGTFIRVKTISGGQDRDVEILTGRAAACHIRPVLAALGIDVATGIVVGSRTTAADEIDVPGDELAEPSILAQVTEIETAVERSAAGRALLDAVRRHESEVRSLIHHRRRVMLAWHRNKGPAFVAASMNALRDGTTALPVEVAGHRLSDLVEALCDALRVEGSAELRRAVEDDAGLLIELVQTCETLEEIIDRLESEAAIAAA